MKKFYPTIAALLLGSALTTSAATLQNAPDTNTPAEATSGNPDVTSESFKTLKIIHPWTGKRVAYFGDSIIDPKNKAASTKYWGWLQQWLDITPYVYGVSGRQWNDIPRQAEALKAEHGNDFDAILIFIGTNDYNAGVPLGQWYTEKDEEVMAGIHEAKHMVTRKHRYMLMNDSTVCGRINTALDKVKRMFPTKQIVILTPIHRAQFNGHEKNWQPREDYRNKCGEHFLSYVNAVKEAGQLWSVPVIDLSELCGLFPLMDEYAQYFNDKDWDRLHPNDAGHKRMALTLLYQLLALPVF